MDSNTKFGEARCSQIDSKIARGITHLPYMEDTKGCSGSDLHSDSDTSNAPVRDISSNRNWQRVSQEEASALHQSCASLNWSPTHDDVTPSECRSQLVLPMHCKNVNNVQPSSFNMWPAAVSIHQISSLAMASGFYQHYTDEMLRWVKN